MTFVTTFVFGGGVPCTFDVVDSHVGARDRGTETNVIEQEEFWFWPEQNGVCDAGRTQVLFSAFSDGAWVAVVALQRAWLEDIATDDQGWLFEEWINDRRGRVWHQNHVRFVNAFPATNGGAVKHFAFFKEFGVYLMSRNCDVLFFTFGISEAQINKLHFMFVQHRQNVFSGHT